MNFLSFFIYNRSLSQHARHDTPLSVVYDVFREDLAGDAADFLGEEDILEEGGEKELGEATIRLCETGFANCIAKPCCFLLVGI